MTLPRSQHGESPSRTWTKLFFIISAMILFLQVYPLFWMRPFYVDWINHVWIVSYYADYFRQHAAWPLTIDTSNHFGNPMPVFYGTYLYPIISVLSLVTNADLAFRLFIATLILGAWMASAISMYSLCRVPSIAIALATLINTSIYQLTNIYSRSALTEFCATEFLILALSFIFYASSGQERKHNFALVAGFSCLTLALGSHPITFYLFALFSIPIIVFSPDTFIDIARKHPLTAALSIIATTVILSPWIFNIIVHHSQLSVSQENTLSKKIFYFGTTIDSPAAKLLPFWVDSRVMFESIGRTSTPFLDAPLPITFMGGFAVLLATFLSRRFLLVARQVLPALATIAILFYLVFPPRRLLLPGIFPGSSFLPLGSDWIHDLLVPIQFAYRLSNTFEAVVLLATFILLARMRHRGLTLTTSQSRNMALVALASLSLISVGVKTMTTYVEYRAYPAYAEKVDTAITLPSFYGSEAMNRVILTKSYDQEILNTKSYPETFYSYFDYAMPRNYSHVDTTTQVIRPQLHVTAWDEEKTVKCEIECVISTDVIPSAFSRATLDGSPDVDTSVDQTGHLSIEAGPGDHIISFHHVGRSLKLISLCIDCLVFWVYGFLILGISIAFQFAIKFMRKVLIDKVLVSSMS